MREVQIGGKTYRIRAAASGNEWRAVAEDAQRGEPFGPAMTSWSAEHALQLVERWLAWQHEHAEALAALQLAERSYHRSVTGHAFAGPDDSTRQESERSQLDAVDAARRRLDAVRNRQPR